MKPEDLRALLERVAAGTTPVTEAEKAFAGLPFEDLGYARLDHHRYIRTGLPEVVYGPNKAPEEIAGIIQAFRRKDLTALVTRLDDTKAGTVMGLLPPHVLEASEYDAISGLLLVGPRLKADSRGQIAVVSAGTADNPVAEEAALTAEIFGHPVHRIRDVGVAGLHRILAVRSTLEAAEVVIVVAGMEGALPSVVKGLVTRPVIGVPTSVGFGANFGGVSALTQYAGELHAGHDRGQYRQWVRCGVRGGADEYRAAGRGRQEHRMKQRVVYFDLVGGAAGDMILASLIDLGASLDDVRSAWAKVGLDRVTAEVVPVDPAGLRALSLDVLIDGELADSGVPEGTSKIVQSDQHHDHGHDHDGHSHDHDGHSHDRDAHSHDSRRP